VFLLSYSPYFSELCIHSVLLHFLYREMLAVLVVCEWSYLSWAQKVLNETNREDFVTCEWVDLHSGDYFEGVVNYLRGLLDREAELADEVEKEKIKRAFLKAVELEERFFENAYHI